MQYVLGRLLVLVLLLAVSASLVQAGECPSLTAGQLGRTHVLLGGRSPAREPTAAEIHKLKALWAREVATKCLGAPVDFSAVKVCSVRVQVVNGVNVDYTVVPVAQGDDRVFTLQAHFPGSWSVGQSERLLSCQAA